MTAFLEVGAFNAGWVFIARLVDVADCIVVIVLPGVLPTPEREANIGCEVVKALSRMLVADFWDVLRRDFDYDLVPLPYEQ